ncbi:MAG: alpha-hydroxy acid oxidase [Bryobacteraceae bacterium]|jgi:L-lactate dehydrogenase (cytochrome)
MRTVGSPRILNIADLRRAAKQRLPRVVFDYIDGGAEQELTMRQNVGAYETITFRPRCAVAIPQCDLRTTVLGTPLDLPFLLAPVSSCRLFYPRGEEVVAEAASAAGTVYIQPTLSGCGIEEVRAASSGPLWYQLYLIGGRDVAKAGIARARAAGFSALVVTIDTPVAGSRERDVRDGVYELLGGTLWSRLPYVAQMLARPGWLMAYWKDGGLMNLPNVALPGGPMPYADIGRLLAESAVTWDDLGWIRDVWNGPIIAKGVHTAEDARRAAGQGVDGIVVSNHGGRQLDGVAATIRVLPEVVAAVGDRIEVLLDGGIRRGSDVVKALSLGAKAVLVGRAYAYGLGAAGGAGVARAIDILRTDIVRTLKLLGCPSVRELDRSYVSVPSDWIR